MSEAAATPERVRWPQAVLVAVAILSLLVVFQNYGHPFLPRQEFTLTPADLRPHPAPRPHVFAVSFDHSEPNQPGVDRSMAMLLENGVPYPAAQRDPAELLAVGGRRWVHEPGRILFSASDNTDPRTNGRTYAIKSPVLYSSAAGVAASLLFVASLAGLYFLRRPSPAAAPVTPACAAISTGRWRWHVGLAAGIFLFGLYCNTGTLSPYAITTIPHEAKGTGYLYNADHIHFRALSDFAQGEERARWDGGIMLRRILFPVLAWPFIKVGGFEIGGTVASLVLNVAAFVWCGYLLRRRIGERGAQFALWVLALYPGAAYWGGLPYPYALIVPLSPLLLIGLAELLTAEGKKFVGLALAMGVAYLAYDFGAFFVPATLLALAVQRRYAAAVVGALCQALPLALWILALGTVFDQRLANSNTSTYAAILEAYRHGTSVAQLGTQLTTLPETLATVFFGANFLFLPGLFLFVVILNHVTSRVRFGRAELALLAVAAGIFLFNHLAPSYGGWQMRGTWIARLYQPVFAVFVLFLARWWQHLPPLGWPTRAGLWTALVACSLGNALIVFGPILMNPLRVSETAYYRFYNHSDMHWIYEEICLQHYGRHPLGFPAKKP
jgi:hypothetical protein